ncbi:MAG: hypothetical protein ACOH2H_03485 [Cypionkella sp.]
MRALVALLIGAIAGLRAFCPRKADVWFGWMPVAGNRAGVLALPLIPVFSGLQDVPGVTGTTILALTRVPARLVVAGSHFLLAIARTPNTDARGLEVTGLGTDARRMIPLNDWLKTKAPGIWTLGHRNGRGEAIHGILDAVNAGLDQRVLYRSFPVHQTIAQLIPKQMGELSPA